MGRKPVGPRQRLLLHLALGLMALILTGGCQHWSSKDAAIENLLQQAEACRRQQDFACAAQLLAPARHPQAVPADPRMIYLAGLVAVDARNPDRSYETACECFQRLVNDHAETPLAAEAVVWLGLLAEVNTRAEALGRMETANQLLQQEIDAYKARLSQMERRLERLKAVDLSLE